MKRNTFVILYYYFSFQLLEYCIKENQKLDIQKGQPSEFGSLALLHSAKTTSKWFADHVITVCADLSSPEPQRIFGVLSRGLNVIF